MTATVMNLVKAAIFISLGLAVAAMGIYVAGADDAPGAAGLGLLLMVAGVVLGVRAARGRLPKWATRTTLAAGIVVAGFVAYLTHAVGVTAPLFAESQAVPSVVDPSPSPQYAAPVERAREHARRALLEQNLPGLSVAVGADGALVWAEGFGWRDVGTRTPVTPATRFHIGTAASAVAASVAPLGLAHSGTGQAAAWSPEHIGEEGEDFPPLTILRHVFWQPLGLMAAEYPLPGDRATFYVPRSDDDPVRGRRLMYMRDLACCVDGMAFSSTPSDLVRIGLTTNPGHIDGELAGGMVMSLTTDSDSGIVVAVTSNIAHANTALLAGQIAAAFADGR